MLEVKTSRVAVYAVIVFVVVGAAAYVAVNFAQWNARLNGAQDAVNAFNRNDFSRVLQQADNALALDPRDVSALLAKAAALAQEASLTFKEEELGAQAAELARQALDIDPASDEAWRILGYTYEIRQNYIEAHKSYRSAYTLNPRNAKAVSQDGHAYDLEGDFVTAERRYREALAIDQSLDQAGMGMARLSLRSGKTREALDLYRHVQETSPNLHVRAEAAYSASIIAGALGDHGSALALAQQATKYDPLYALGWVGYGKEVFESAVSTSTPRTLDERNRLMDESFNSLKKAIDINPGQSIAHFQMAAQFAAIGQTKNALMILGQVKKMVPNDITLSGPDKQLLLRQIDDVVTLINN